jgi:hypothetical protein
VYIRVTIQYHPLSTPVKRERAIRRYISWSHFDYGWVMDRFSWTRDEMAKCLQATETHLNYGILTTVLAMFSICQGVCVRACHATPYHH